MSDEMKITAIAPWFGGKRNLAPAIVEELGPHRVYWEPYCGSMAVLLAKPACVMETVNDLHGDLINLARVIQHATAGPALYRRLRRTMMAEPLHREAAERHKARGRCEATEPDVDRAYDYFLCAWLGRNGCAGTESYNQGFCLRFTASGGHAATRWVSVVNSIPAWRRRLAAVTILCRDAFDLIPRIEDAAGTAIYFDPPYLKKGAKYVHDFSSADHLRLAEQLARFKLTRVVASYYADPQLAELYPGWPQRHIEVSRAIAMQGARGKNDRKATEVLLLNGPSYTADATPNGRLFA
jgi:DNA adenine methylase